MIIFFQSLLYRLNIDKIALVEIMFKFVRSFSTKTSCLSIDFHIPVAYLSWWYTPE